MILFYIIVFIGFWDSFTFLQDETAIPDSRADSTTPASDSDAG